MVRPANFLASSPSSNHVFHHWPCSIQSDTLVLRSGSPTSVLRESGVNSGKRSTPPAFRKPREAADQRVTKCTPDVEASYLSTNMRVDEREGENVLRKGAKRDPELYVCRFDQEHFPLCYCRACPIHRFFSRAGICPLIRLLEGWWSTSLNCHKFLWIFDIISSLILSLVPLSNVLAPFLE